MSTIRQVLLRNVRETSMFVLERNSNIDVNIVNNYVLWFWTQSVR